MSESGKVSLPSMTPEQIEEMGMTLVLMEAELIATKMELKEAQQTIVRYKSALEIIRDNTDDQGAIDCVNEALGEGAKES